MGEETKEENKKYILIQEVNGDLLGVERFNSRKELLEYVTGLEDIIGVEIYEVSKQLKLTVTIEKIEGDPVSFLLKRAKS